METRESKLRPVDAELTDAHRKRYEALTGQPIGVQEPAPAKSEKTTETGKPKSK